MCVCVCVWPGCGDVAGDGAPEHAGVVGCTDGGRTQAADAAERTRRPAGPACRRTLLTLPRHFGLTENNRHENDGPSKLQDTKLQNMNFQDKKTQCMK